MTAHSPATAIRCRVRNAFAAALLASTGVGAMVLPVSSASAQTARSFDIAAGSLANALNDLAEQSGVQLIYAGALVEGRSSPGLKGSVSTAQALSQLLAGSGITFRQTGANAYTLERAPQAADGAVNLGPVRVEGEGAGNGNRYSSPANGTALTEGTGSLTTNGPVTAATGLALTLRETPQSVTVITRERMDNQALNSITDVVQQMTGVSSFGLGGGTAASYSWFDVRGFRLTTVLLDGVPIPVSLFGDSVDSIAYDSVSLIRGANGLMAGSGEPAGTIGLTRKRPTEVFSAAGSLQIGRWNQVRGTVDVGGPLVDSGKLRGRIAVAYGEGDTWLDRYNEDEFSLYGIIEADVGERSRVFVSVESGRTVGRAGGPYQLSTFFVDGSPTPFTRGDNAFATWSFNREKRINVTVGFDHEFSDDWSARAQYIHGDGSSTRKFGNVSASPELDGEVGLYGRRIGNDIAPRAWGGSVDGRYSLWGREHQIVVGFNGYTEPLTDHVGNTAWEDVWPNVFDWQGIVDEPDWDSLPDPWERFKGTTTQYGAFLSNRLEVLDSLAVITGARLSNWRYKYRSLDTGILSDNRKQNGVFTPFLGIVYDFTSALSAYASYTTIFQPNSSRDQSGRVLDPQDGNAYELGLKGAWFDNRLNASAAVYEIRKNNLPVPDGGLTPMGDDSYVATDHTKARGWEVEVAGEILPGWSLQGGYARTIIRDSSGVRLLTTAPKETLKLFTTWTPQFVPDLTVGGGVNWQSKVYADWVEPAALPAATIRPYTLVNLFGRYRIGQNLSLAVNVNNLFDKAYRVDETAHDYGAPRNVRFTLRAGF